MLYTCYTCMQLTDVFVKCITGGHARQYISAVTRLVERCHCCVTSVLSCSLLQKLLRLSKIVPLRSPPIPHLSAHHCFACTSNLQPRDRLSALCKAETSISRKFPYQIGQCEDSSTTFSRQTRVSFRLSSVCLYKTSNKKTQFQQLILLNLCKPYFRTKLLA